MISVSSALWQKMIKRSCCSMDYSDKSNNQFIQDIIFTKNSIKDLEDSIYIYYPKKYYDVLPLLHKAYDSIALTLYRLNKHN